MAVETLRSSSAPQPPMWKRVGVWLQGVRVELKKVTWPDRAQVRQATIAIVIFVLLIGLVITILDAGLRLFLVQLIPSLVTGR
jgi:preprotein translocase subunit SecE